jgi:hypothetical protein
MSDSMCQVMCDSRNVRLCRIEDVLGLRTVDDRRLFAETQLCSDAAQSRLVVAPVHHA